MGSVPTMNNHLGSVQLMERLGFKSVWIRVVLFNVPSFGDAGETFDPFTCLGYLIAQNKEIALGVASIALPLHHPVHIAKSAATIDQLSGGRLILGIASGDRTEEYSERELILTPVVNVFVKAFTVLEKLRRNFRFWKRSILEILVDILIYYLNQ